MKNSDEEQHADWLRRYIFITYSTEQYLSVSADIVAPLGKICSIVQSPVNFYGTQFLSKSLTFAWCWLGSKPYHNVRRDDHYRMLQELSGYCDEGKIKSHVTQRLKLTLDGLRKGHELIESKKMIGKVAFGIAEEGVGESFC